MKIDYHYVDFQYFFLLIQKISKSIELKIKKVIILSMRFNNLIFEDLLPFKKK